ncbi:MAG: glycosyltransferase family 39 protein [Candidatus Paceibacterota bacterium]|jgi:4-amino-4-deoxy-L-arabinose transferase-like glycosyltransferase
MMNYTKERKARALLVSILFVAIFARFLFLYARDVPVIADAVLYAQSGKNFIETGRYATSGGDLVDIVFPPGYPIAVGLADHFFNNPLFSLRFVSFVFGSLLVHLFYLTGREMSGEKAGLFASFFAATNSTLILFSQEVYSESMFFFFTLLSFYLFLRLSKEPKNKNAVFFGFSIGMSYLIRPEGLLLMVLPFIFLLRIIKKFQYEILLRFLLVLFVTFFVMFPYVYFLSQKTGKPAITAKMSTNLAAGINFDGADMSRLSRDHFLRYEENEANYNEQTNELDYPKEEFKNTSILTVLLDNNFSGRYIAGFRSEAYALSADHWAGILLLPILLAIIYAVRDQKNRKNILVLSILSAELLIMFPIFHIESRYLAQVLIFLILFASLGYAGYKGPGTELLPRKFTVFIKNLVIVLISSSFILFLYLSFVTNEFGGFCNYAFCINTNVRDRSFPPTENSLAYEYKIAGEYIKNNSDSGEGGGLIMSRRPVEVSFYAGMDSLGITFPDTSAENVIKFAKANNVKYIIVDKRYLGVRKNYKDLASLQDFSNDVYLVFEDSSVSDIKLFQVK